MSVSVKKKTPGKKRIRENLLPSTAKHATLDRQDFVMIPVEDFGEWYEDTVDAAIAQERREAGADVLPLDEVRARIMAGRRNKKQ